MNLGTVSRGLWWFFSIGVPVVSLTVVVLASIAGFQNVAPHLAHYVGSHDLPLYSHIVFAPLALLVMPFQFWGGLRNRHRMVHRVLGYTYAVSILVSGIGSLLLLPRFLGSTWAATGFALLAILWMGTTLTAIGNARAGRTAAHRVWMMRSAAMTFAAVVLRLIMFPLVMAGMTPTGTYDITAWISWLIPLAYVEWRLRRAGNARQTRAQEILG